MPVRKVNFSPSALSSFMHSSSFPGIEEKTNSQEPGKLIFSQVKCHLLYFVLILGENVPGPGEMVFELEELIGVFLVFSFCPWGSDTYTWGKSVWAWGFGM